MAGTITAADAARYIIGHALRAPLTAKEESEIKNLGSQLVSMAQSFDNQVAQDGEAQVVPTTMATPPRKHRGRPRKVQPEGSAE